MNYPYLTATLSAVFAGATFVTAQEPVETSPEPAPPNEVPVLKDVPIRGRLFAAADSKSGGSVSVKSSGGGTGKATVTIEVNGKKETREIDLGNAAEIKIVTESSDSPKIKRVTFLGVTPEELSEQLAAQLPIEAGSGLIVRTVIPESPAAAAGLQKNDILIQLDDQLLSAPKQLQKLVASRKPGESVRIVYLRRGQRAEVEAKLAEHDESADASAIRYFIEGLGGGGDYKVGDVMKVPGDILSFQKKAVVVDKDGRVIAKHESSDDRDAAVKKLAEQVERMREQAEAAQKKAQEAIRHAEIAAREAAEIAKKEASAAVERMQDQLRKVHAELERRELERSEKQPPKQ